MNNFFNSIMDWLRGVKESITSKFLPGYTKTYNFGQIVSGTYKNYKHDPNPTIFCMGTYINPRLGRSYVHGFNLHYLRGSDLQWIINLILNMKVKGQPMDPRQLYYYIKSIRPNLVNVSYRIYHTELCDFRTISPGVSNLDVKSCYSVKDSRDYFVTQLNQMINYYYGNGMNVKDPQDFQPSYNTEELQQHIQQVLNTRKIW